LAVSGGADSLCLAALAGEWAASQGGTAIGYVVDHGLRPDSGSEATDAAATLRALGIPARILILEGLAPGPALPARARAARYSALQAACWADGVLDLLLGHHAADQAETVLMRADHSSGPAGLSGMAAAVETNGARLLRPLLAVPPGRLRATLRARGITWTEDPTNHDQRFLRARLRAGRADPDGDSNQTGRLCDEALMAGRRRRESEHQAADWLGRHATIRPDGLAILPPGPWPEAALGALLRCLAGRNFAPAPQRITALAASPHASCLGGLRLVAVGEALGGGFLLMREAAAIGPPVAAKAGAVWDNRFRRPAGAAALPGEQIEALGARAAAFRDFSDLPAAALATLPAFVRGNDPVAVPALGWPNPAILVARRLVFSPPQPIAGSGFIPAMPRTHDPKTMRNLNLGMQRVARRPMLG
jgi:tRNA(Ile)-lysidine synthase